MENIKFNGYNLNLKYLKSDKSVRVEIETSQDQYNTVKEIPNLPEGVYVVTITPLIDGG